MIAPALRTGVARSGWLPAAFLVLGLGAVLGIVSSSADVSLSSLRHFRSDHGIYPVGSFPNGWWSYTDARLFYPAIGGNVHAATGAFSLVYLGAATALGSFLVDGLRGDDRWPRPVSALAGFLPGYLMLLAPLQLLFACVAFRTAGWIALLGVPAVALAVHRHALAGAATALRHDRATRWSVASSAAVVSAVVGIAAVHRLQAGNFFLMQDSLLWWLLGAGDQLRGDLGAYLAQWNQQTDEWVFNAPMLFRSYTDRDALFIFYATQSLGLASFACLAFGIAHRLAQRRRTLAAYVATGVVLASTPLIYPWRYITIIGGDNPVLWTGQSGRQIGIVAPWAALLLIGQRRRATMLAVALATAGLAFTSLQNAIYVVAAVGVGLAWRERGGLTSTWLERPRLRAVAHLLPVATVAMLVYAFWWLHQTWTPADAAWWVLGSAAVALIGAIAIGLGTPARVAVGSLTARWTWVGAWVVVLAGGFVLSNNSVDSVFGGGSRSLLGLVLPGYRGALQARTDLGGDVFGNLTFPTFASTGCEYYNYCTSFGDFLASFGFLLVLALATWLALGRMTTDAATNARRVAWLLTVAGTALAIIVMFFTVSEGAIQPLVFSRLLDVPYYGLLGLAALTFTGARDRVTAIVGTGVLAIWTIVPLIGSQWPGQMARNSAWLLRHAGLS